MGWACSPCPDVNPKFSSWGRLTSCVKEPTPRDFFVLDRRLPTFRLGPTGTPPASKEQLLIPRQRTSFRHHVACARASAEAAIWITVTYSAAPHIAATPFNTSMTQVPIFRLGQTFILPIFRLGQAIRFIVVSLVTRRWTFVALAWGLHSR